MLHYLNTYHVKVQCFGFNEIKINDSNLNTYHVKVQSIISQNPNILLKFKYISC